MIFKGIQRYSQLLSSIATDKESSKCIFLWFCWIIAFLGYQRMKLASQAKNNIPLSGTLEWTSSFLNYWPFVRGIHQSLADSPRKGPVMQRFDVSFVVNLNKLLNKQFGMPCKLCYINIMKEVYHKHSKHQFSDSSSNENILQNESW